MRKVMKNVIATMIEGTHFSLTAGQGHYNEYSTSKSSVRELDNTLDITASYCSSAEQEALQPPRELITRYCPDVCFVAG